MNHTAMTGQSTQVCTNHGWVLPKCELIMRESVRRNQLLLVPRPHDRTDLQAAKACWWARSRLLAYMGAGAHTCDFVSTVFRSAPLELFQKRIVRSAVLFVGRNESTQGANFSLGLWRECHLPASARQETRPEGTPCQRLQVH